MRAAELESIYKSRGISEKTVAEASRIPLHTLGTMAKYNRPVPWYAKEGLSRLLGLPEDAFHHEPENLDELFLVHGTTVYSYARETGSSNSHVRAIVNGERPLNRRVAGRIANHFGVPIPLVKNLWRPAPEKSEAELIEEMEPGEVPVGRLCLGDTRSYHDLRLEDREAFERHVRDACRPLHNLLRHSDASGWLSMPPDVRAELLRSLRGVGPFGRAIADRVESVSAWEIEQRKRPVIFGDDDTVLEW